MIVLISDDSRENWGLKLQKAMLPTEARSLRFAANTLDIKCCTACSSCSGKTYGRCVIRDDMQVLLAKIVRCRALVLVSPIVFGGVSFHIKKLLDRMSPVGDPRYRLRDGELVKGSRGKERRYYLLGIGDNLSRAEESAFFQFHEENRKIMDVKGRAFILSSRPDRLALEKIAREICHE